jgi:diguanylate cyclase (GGDEF)-like protein/PAS domain S-box-containing protein
MPPDRFQFDLYRVLAPALVGLLVCFLVPGLRRERRARPEARAWAVYTLATMGYLLSNLAELFSKRTETALFWSSSIFLFIGFLPLIWLEFCLRFTRDGKGLARPLVAGIALIPIATLVVVFTPSLRPLMWTSIEWFKQGPWLVSFRRLGPWFTVYAVYSYTLYLYGVFVVLRAFVHFRKYYRRQSAYVIVAVAIPLLASINYVFKPLPGLVKDFTSLGYAAAAILLYIAIFRRDLFELSPVARSLVVERMRDGILVLDTRMRLADANPAAFEILGLGEADIGEELPLGRVIDGEGHDVVGLIYESVELGGSREFSIDEGGDKRWYEADTRRLGEGREGILVTIKDQTEVRLLLMRIAELASLDELTRLPNRRSFMREAARELSRAERHGLPLAVAMLDLDRFKDVNDSHGHRTGDQVLREFGKIVAEEIREEDLAGRIGGEEFALVFVGAREAGARAFCERIRARFEAVELVDEEGLRVRVTVSAGFAIYGPEKLSFETLLSRADAALYQAKEEGRNQVVAWEAMDFGEAL